MCGGRVPRTATVGGEKRLTRCFCAFQVSCERVAHTTRKNAKQKVFCSRKEGSKAQWLHHRQRNGLYWKNAVPQAYGIPGIIHLLGSRRRRWRRKNKSTPLMRSKLFRPTKCYQVRLRKTPGVSYICINHFTTTNYGSWLQIPYSNPKYYYVRTYLVETSTRGVLTTQT